MKNLLFTICFGLIISITGNTQNLTLSDSTGQIPHGSFVTIGGSPSSGLMTSYAFVTNNSANPMGVKVRKIENYVVPDAMNLFCWGLCFGPQVYVSPDTLLIGPGQTNFHDFHGEYFPNGTTGTTSMTYVFFDDANPNDSVAFHVLYKTEGLPELAQIEPDSGEAGTNVAVEISGVNTHFTIPTEVYLKKDDETIMAISSTPVNELVLNANFEIPANATIGLWDVCIKNLLDGEVILVEAFEIFEIIGIEDNPETSLKIYPNPATDILNISLERKFSHDLFININTLEGKTVKKIVLPAGHNSSLIEIGDLSSGMYLIHFSGRDFNLTKKIQIID